MIFDRSDIKTHNVHNEHTDLLSDEFKRRKDYNIKILFMEIYKPNTRLEKIVGCSTLHSDSFRIKNNLTDQEIEECYDLVAKEVVKLISFSDCFIFKLHKLYADYLVEAARRSENVTTLRKDKIFFVPELKKIYNHIAVNYEFGSVEMEHINKFKSEVPDNREDRLIDLETKIKLLPTIIEDMIEASKADMDVMKANFYGTDEPLYSFR